jgi:putative ABC transport system ATP-binding protein
MAKQVIDGGGETLIELDDVWKIYQLGEVEVPALRGVSLAIKQGNFVAIVGASGSGKSTMVNLIGCLDTPTKGALYLRGKDVTRLSESDLASLRGKTVGFVFQQYNLIHDLSALQNVMLPLELQEMDDTAARKRAKELLALVGLGDKIHNRPGQLSGGQQQRVSIARALAADPDIVLADEPTGALDSVTGREVICLLHDLWKKGKTIIMITHDRTLAQFAHTQVELSDGRIVNIQTTNYDCKMAAYHRREKHGKMEA